MLKFSLTLFFLLSINLLWASDLVEVNQKESSEFQESAFIRLMNKLNGGKIPYPFSKLLDSFGTGVRQEGNILLVPEGRSLVKESADFHNPRIIVEPVSRGDAVLYNQEKGRYISERDEWTKNRKKINEMGIVDGEVYIGFAPNHKALEVISYNPKKPGYDFFVVEDYEEGKKPKIVSNPSLCLSCHQNEAPIFSRFPWHEVMGASADRENLRDLFFSQNTRIMNDIRAANPERDSIEGIDLEKKNKERFSGLQVSNFDTLVRSSNSLLLGNRVCAAICADKDSIECQKNLIKIAMSEKKDFKSSPYFQNMIKNLDSVEMKSSVIPNRNPREVLQNNPLKKQDEFMMYDEVSAGITPVAINNVDSIDPTYKRPINSELEKLKIRVKKEKNINTKMIIIANACVPQVALDVLFTPKIFDPSVLNDPLVESTLKEWPVTKNIPIAVRKVLERKTINTPNMVEKRDCPDVASPVMPVYKYSGVSKVIEKLSEEEIKKPGALFQKYCTQCHGGERAFIPLPLGEPEKMANYMPKFGKLGVEERLVQKIMPPPSIELQPTEKERAELVKLMKALKK